MAKIQKIPINDLLQEFRIRALTTPPEAIELTSLDREMSEILAKNDIPKEIKLKLYYDALNKFQNVRNMILKPHGADALVQKTPVPDKKKREWDFGKEEERNEIFEKIRKRLQSTFISDDGETIYDENEVLGTKEEMKDALEFFLSLEPEFAATKRPSSFLKHLNQNVLSKVADIIEDSLNDAGIESDQLKEYFPRLGWNLFSKRQKKIAALLKTPIAQSTSAAAADAKKEDTSSSSSAKRDFSSDFTEGNKKRSKTTSGAVAVVNADTEDENNSRKKTRKYHGRQEVSPVEIPASSRDHAIASNLRSSFSRNQSVANSLRTRKSSSSSNRFQTGRGIHPRKYLIDFNEWDSSIRLDK